MTAREYRQRINEARAKHNQALLKELRWRRTRNLWRGIVRKRVRQAKEAAKRRKRARQPHIVGHNRVFGGTARERIVYLCEIAMKEFRLYYSEQGPWDTNFWAVQNVPNDNWRSDCSSWVLNVMRSVGLESFVAAPSFDNSGGNTTSIVERCTQVTESFARSHPGTIVVFFSSLDCYPNQSIHCGLSKGNGTPELWQHGQEPVEGGYFHEFGPGYGVRFYDVLTNR